MFTAPLHHELPPGRHTQRLPRGTLRATEGAEQAAQLRPRGVRVGGDVHALLLSPRHPVVGPRLPLRNARGGIDVAHGAVGPEHRLELWHVHVPVEPVLVQLSRGPVRRRDNGAALVPHPLKQLTQDGRVGDIANLKLVEAQQPVFLRQLGAHSLHGSNRPSLRALLFVYVLMHREHEFVKVYAARWQGGESGARMTEEEVHEEGFAGADRTVEE
mmetsp:Transcript_29294/g.71886  ORF Transcript_29294/g.71886 Transcript_29294/m.71886 type:complete len:215 (-) Transcript_29294:336-980(-)